MIIVNQETIYKVTYEKAIKSHLIDLKEEYCLDQSRSVEVKKFFNGM